MADTTGNNLYEAHVLLGEAAAALGAMTQLLCDYQDGVPLPSDGLRLMLAPVENNVRQGLELVDIVRGAVS